MTPEELLEATKAEVDKRWKPYTSLWSFNGEACLLGCLGFAYWGESFEQDWEDEGYALLRSDPVVTRTIAILADHVNPDDLRANPNDDIEIVYRQNDFRFRTKADAQDFIEQALADLKTLQSA